MAKLERHLTGDLDELLDYLHRGILNGSASASYEDGSDYESPDGLRCAVRVYERYSMMGGNRVTSCPPSPPAAARRCSSRSTLWERVLFWTAWRSCWTAGDRSLIPWETKE